MTVAGQIGWGKYGGYEGPLFWGSAPVRLSDTPTDAEKVLQVVTSTEGGKWNAVNMYDRMIISVGAIQWGEAGMFGVSDMLGVVAERDPSLLDPLSAAMGSGVEFKKNGSGHWRFFVAGVEVTTLAQQQHLFLGSSNGHEGTWDDGSKALAREWAAGMANVFEQVEAQKAQAEFTLGRLRAFAFKEAQAILWGSDEALPNKGWVGALRAAYLSFAANLPAVANAQIQKAPVAGLTKWSPEWCVAILRQLTFGPNIAIYPGRYNSIRPVIEKLYGVDLPDFAADLKTWHASEGIDLDPAPETDVPPFTNIGQIQSELLQEGYDLGPKGSDGQDGPKTQEAVRSFQTAHGLTSDGIVGPATRKALVAEWVKRKNG